MKLENLTTNDLGRHCIYLDEVDSTNEYLKREGASLPHGTLVLAGCQTAGKGRLGRRWAATDRDALAMSLLLRDFDVQRLSALPLVCGMAVAQGLREMTGRLWHQMDQRCGGPGQKSLRHPLRIQADGVGCFCCLRHRRQSHSE